MGTRMQDEGHRILEALEEGMVTAVITLYNSKTIPDRSHPGATVSPWQRIHTILTSELGMNEESADYWLNYFQVKD